ncbi:hypothetical protein IC615_16250 [Serratia ureilytica]
MQQQLNAAKTDLADAVKALALQPDNSDAIINQLVAKLKNRVRPSRKMWIKTP